MSTPKSPTNRDRASLRDEKLPGSPSPTEHVGESDVGKEKE